MKISILTPNVSQNCVGRAHMLAKVLQRHYEIEIVGPIGEDGMWEPFVNDKSVPYKLLKVNGASRRFQHMRELAIRIEGNVIYASKPILTSLGVGLLKKFVASTPLILDIDDWQLGFMKESNSNAPFFHRSQCWTSLSFWACVMGEKLSRLADDITVASRFLQKKFGGTIVCHARDTEAFDPDQFDEGILREKYSIERRKRIVMFLGTPRSHKGIEDLIKAVDLVEDHDTLLVVVGIDDKDHYSKGLVGIAKKILNGRFREYGVQPFEKVPEFLTIADVVVVPQKRNSSTIGQVPAKVFDAMAMAKPIIATDVSDLPDILKGCGWIVEPDNPEQLAMTIQYVCEHQEEAAEMGRRARQKCIESYSWNALEKILVPIFKKYE
ncbi:MAG: glycosyltransferase family 4 protein [Thermodesulfobacteriota bacterium]